MLMKSNTGYVYKDSKGRWTARLTYSADGRRRNIERRAQPNTKNRAKVILKELIARFETSGARAVESERMTFNQLARHYDSNYLLPPEYRDGRKIVGLRSLATPKRFLRDLAEHFGPCRLRNITYGSIRTYRNARLSAPTRKTGKPPAVATVNREMALLRRMLNVAVREGWLTRNPFNAGEPLIVPADECRRERILTREEEERLLAECAGRRAHLRPLVVCALDTGMRRGELLKLLWQEVDFEEGVIHVRAFNTKTMRARLVAMSARVESGLRELFGRAADPAGPVFGGVKEVKKGFDTARRRAGLSDVRFHDLRHTAATRLVGGHIPLSEVGRVLGHTQPSTTYRYVNANVETARRAAAAMDAFNGGVSQVNYSEAVN
jgi:integrase